MFELRYKDCVPIKERLSVNGSRPLWSSRKGKSWRLLTVNSRETKNVLNHSSCPEGSLSTYFSDHFIIETIDSQEITIHGLDGALNSELTPLLVK